MRPTTTILLAMAALGAASPAVAQPNPQQLLQGLLSGNQGQDDAVRDAFERGYRRGREDQERADRDRGPPPDERGYPPPGERGYPPPDGYGR